MFCAKFAFVGLFTLSPDPTTAFPGFLTLSIIVFTITMHMRPYRSKAVFQLAALQQMCLMIIAWAGTLLVLGDDDGGTASIAGAAPLLQIAVVLNLLMAGLIVFLITRKIGKAIPLALKLRQHRKDACGTDVAGYAFETLLLDSDGSSVE